MVFAAAYTYIKFTSNNTYFKKILFFTLIIIISNSHFSNATVSYRSQYTTKPPIIDGDVTFEEWSGAGEIWNDVGVAMVKNDGTNLYLLVDVLIDTGNDSILPLGEDGDSVYIAFDVNLDSEITSADIEFSVDPESRFASCSRFIGPLEWSESINSKRSKIVAGFGSTPNKLVPHRFWEASIGFDELKSGVGELVRLGVEMNSVSPEFGYQIPANYTGDFSHLLEVQLQKPPINFNHLFSTAVFYPVTIDGRVTDIKEWADSRPIYPSLTNADDVSSSYNATVWAKNNDELLYFLIMVEPNSPDYSIQNGFGVIYRWQDESGERFYDESTTFLDGATTDWCELDNGIWEHDTHPMADGRMNVNAKGSFDGENYWFEICKPMNSGDGCDWALKPGETIGASQDYLYLVFWDMDAAIIEFSASMILSLHGKPLISSVTDVDEQKTGEPETGTYIDDDLKIRLVDKKRPIWYRAYTQPVLFSSATITLSAVFLWFNRQGSVIILPSMGEIDIQDLANKKRKQVSKVESVIDKAVENGELTGFYTKDRKKFMTVDQLKLIIREKLFPE